MSILEGELFNVEQTQLKGRCCVIMNSFLFFLEPFLSENATRLYLSYSDSRIKVYPDQLLLPFSMALGGIFYSVAPARNLDICSGFCPPFTPFWHSYSGPSITPEIFPVSTASLPPTTAELSLSLNKAANFLLEISTQSQLPDTSANPDLATPLCFTSREIGM